MGVVLSSNVTMTGDEFHLDQMLKIANMHERTQNANASAHQILSWKKKILR